MAFTAIACQNSSDESCDEPLLIKASEKIRKNVLNVEKEVSGNCHIPPLLVVTIGMAH